MTDHIHSRPDLVVNQIEEVRRCLKVIEAEVTGQVQGHQGKWLRARKPAKDAKVLVAAIESVISDEAKS